jgi:chromate reductase, NAD(P)H dehydrogenase (quinone)
MTNKKKILAICGSTKRTSLNLSLINAIADLTAEDFNLTVFSGIEAIPHFNPDLDNETPPAQVVNFRNQLKEADGILICTPEYAMGVPGTLKNAIDWTVSSCEFSHKPVALITASSQGFKAHQSLLETLKIIESNITDDTHLVISFVKTKISPDNKIKDQETLTSVLKVLSEFKKLFY